MDFSEVIGNIQNAVFSSDNSLVAITNGTKVIIKNAIQLNNVQVFTFPDIITHMEFSPDCQYFLACMSKKGIIEARAVYDEEWRCKIEDPVLGILYARWSPDSRHIISFSDYSMRASIYSMIDKNIFYIKNPKFCDKGLTFSNDGKFMAIAERKDTKDFIGIYYTSDWKLVNYLQADTYDLQDIQWAPDNSCIVCVDTSLEYKLLVYNPAQGLLHKYSAYDYALGIKSFKFSNNSAYLAVGSYDEKIRIFNCLTWKLVTELEHKSALSNVIDAHIYKEEEVRELFAYSAESGKATTKYVMLENSVKLPSVKVATDKPNPQLGVGQIQWSPDNQFIASRNDNMPNVLWIWDANTLTLKAVLIQLQSIKSFTWSDNSDYLVFCTGSSKIFFWSLNGASVCDVPFEGKTFNVSKIDWSTDGNTMLLFDKNELVIGYPPSDFLLRGHQDENRGEHYESGNDGYGDDY